MRASASRGCLLAMVLVSCGHEAPPPPSVSELVGCYDLRVSPWQGDRLAAIDSLQMAPFLPPPRIELIDAPFDTIAPGPDRLLVRPAPGSRPSPHRYAFWTLSGDSLVAVWGTGVGGVLVTLRPEGDSLRGHASPMSDAEQGRRPVSDATAMPVACDAPPEYPAAASERVARSIPLTSGKSLVLGEPLDASIPVTRREDEQEIRVRAEPAGRLAGARGVYVVLTRTGVVRQIRLDFAAATRADSLATVLEKVLVRPGPSSSAGGRGPWRDWTTTLSLSPRRDGLSVLLWDPRLR